jgi:MarR family
VASDIATYLIRSLLSEGRIRYEVVEKTGNGLKPRLIEKEGPTGLIVTTTATKLHPENETRLLSLAVKDTPKQTKAILRALARGNEVTLAVEFGRWQALQKWLGAGERRVVVPFAERLADLVPPVAVRLRRDFRLLLTLIEAHALLHRERRARDQQGRIVAKIGDYAAVRELVADLFGEGVDATVKPETRQTILAVAALKQALGKDEMSLAEIAKELTLDKGAASRRVAEAVSRGYLVNAETRKGKPARIGVNDPLPSEIEILPRPHRLAGCCSVAPLQEGIDAPSPEADRGAELAEIEI